jgi:CO/xanthine dehydrogenase Mo-binding subunit
VWVRGGTEPSFTLAELAEIGRREIGGPIIGQASYLAEFPPFDPSLAEGLTYPAFLAPSFSAHAARIRVDRDTGKVTVCKLAAAHDVGRAINPLAVEGQIEGGVAMALGFGLMEEVLMSEGRVLNPNLLDYKLLTAVDMPPVQPIIVECPSSTGPFGVKGVGEPPASLPAAAVANAVADAVGARVHRLPMTPEAVLRLLAG